MIRKIVAGNWKMNKTFSEANQLIDELITLLDNNSNKKVDVILAPAFVFLNHTVELTKGLSKVKVAAQNCSDKASGAFTGEVSAAMISSVGCQYVIIGHSERRQYFNETDQIITDKVNQALSNKLSPIFCCGEVLDHREKQIHEQVVKEQIQNAHFHLNEDEIKQVIVAYEPVWAIGTGLTASPAQAQQMHQVIRQTIAQKYSQRISDVIPILYGGSCNAANASEIFSQKDVDGGLIGGASLKANDFVSIINSF